MKTVVQILPRAPGAFNGVADYGLNLAHVLRNQHEADTIFMTPEPRASAIESFPIVTMDEPQRFRALTNARCDGVILHYVNYGFQKRGVPFSLVRFLKTLRRECGAALLVIFHELFASGPPWKSEFWLRPLQKKIAREISQLADARFVSSESMRAQLAELSSAENIFVHPVPSTFGEPVFTEAQLRERDPHSWTICGGTSLLERSVHSFAKIAGAIPAENAPRNLFLLGGARNPRIERTVRALPNVRADYRPQISGADASALLARATFAWLDYFHHADVPADFLLKSSSFASICAHGVIPVAPMLTGEISLGDEALAAPFQPNNLPVAPARARTALAIHCWYRRHAALARLAERVGSIFERAENLPE